jgi:tetratricopeptide (TPR) repeat protein
MEPSTAAVPPDLPVRGGESSPAGSIVSGREFHLLEDALLRWRGAAGAPDPSRRPLAVLSGGPGSGKSLLLRAAASALKERGVRTAITACRRERLPLEPVSLLLANLLGVRCSPRPEAGEVRESGENLADLAPEIRRILPGWGGEGEERPSLGPEPDRSRLIDALARAVIASAREPLVVFWDDLQWIDPASLEVLAAALRMARCRGSRPDGPRLLVVAGVRPDGKEGLDELLDPWLLGFEVVLRGCSRDDLRESAEAMGLRLPLSLREAILRATGGNVFLARFFLEEIRAGRPVSPSLGDARCGSAEVFRCSVIDRLRAQSVPVRRAVRILAVLGRPVPAALFSAVLARESAPADPPVAEVLPVIVDEGWARTEVLADGAQEIAITGDPLAEVVRAAIPRAERKAIHAAIGEEILASSARPESPPGPRTASANHAFHHLLLAGRHPRVVEAGIAAAREANALGSPQTAVDVCERLFEERLRARDEEAWAVVGEALAAALEEIGAHREALDVLGRVAGTSSRSRTPEERARILRWTGRLHGRLGEMGLEAECYRRGLEALEEAPRGFEVMKLSALLAGLWPHGSSHHGDPGGCLLSLIPEEKDLAPGAEALDVLVLAEEARYNRGENEDALALERAISRRAGEERDEGRLIRSAVHLSHLHSLRGDPVESKRFLALALERSVKAGSRLLEARLLVRMAKEGRASGASEEVLTNLRRASQILEELGDEGAVADIRRSLIHLLLANQDIPGATAVFEDYADSVPSRKDPGPADRVFPLDLGAVERAEAAVRCRQALRRSPVGSDPRRAFLIARMAEFLVDDGKISEASRLCEDALGGWESGRDPFGAARILQAAGRLRRLLGDRARALFLFEKSLDLLKPAPEKGLVGTASLEVSAIFLAGGEGGKAYDCLLRGVRMFLDLEDDHGLAIAMLHLAEFLHEIGLPDLSLRLSAPVSAICRKLSLRRWEVQALRLRGALVSEAGDRAESERSFRRAASLLENLGLVVESLGLRIQRGWESYRREDYPAAHAVAREGIEAARSLGAVDLLDDFLFLLGSVESALSNKSKNFLRALEILDKALLGAHERGRASVEAQVLLTIALLYEERGKDDLGREYRSRAAAILDHLGSRLPGPIANLCEGTRARTSSQLATA